MLRILLIVLTVCSCAPAVKAQGDTPQESEQVTPEDALKEIDRKEKVLDEALEGGRKAHVKRQDKATQKRMKKNLRRAQKHSWGKEVPWYKRWFRKKKFN